MYICVSVLMYACTCACEHMYFCRQTYVHTVDIYVCVCTYVDIIECNSTPYVGMMQKNGGLYRACIYYAYEYLLIICTLPQQTK